MPELTLSILSHQYAVCRLDPNGPIPTWTLLGDDFVSLTRTRDELSVICMQENVPPDAQAERGWYCAKVEGRFEFSVSGINASLALPLAEAKISVLAVATYETDHILIQEKDLEHAIHTLEAAGHHVIR